MFEEIKTAEDYYEERMGYKAKDKPSIHGVKSLTFLLIQSLYAIAREVRDIRKDLDETKVKVHGLSNRL